MISEQGIAQFPDVPAKRKTGEMKWKESPLSTSHPIFQMQAMEALGPGVKYSLVHGKLSGTEKVEAIQKFASGETPVLVSTSVVEVSRTSVICHSLKEMLTRKLPLAENCRSMQHHSEEPKL